MIAFLRQIILFVLGVAVVVDALAAPGANIGEMIIGLVLLGLVSFEELITDTVREWRRNHNHDKTPTG